MRLSKLPESSHPLFSIKEDMNPPCLRNQTLYSGCWSRIQAIWLYLLCLALYIVIHWKRRHILTRNRDFWEIYESLFCMLPWWRIKYRIEMTAVYLFKTADELSLFQIQACCDRVAYRSPLWLRIAVKKKKEASVEASCSPFRVLDLKAHFLLEAWLDWLYLAVVIPGHLHVWFDCSNIKCLWNLVVHNITWTIDITMLIPPQGA